MSEYEHTPGPWNILDGAILCDQVNDYGNFHIARFDRGDNPNTLEDLANARLIAAAPDLLAACKKMVEVAPTIWGEDPENWLKVMDRIENAIAKAQGE